MIAPTCSRACRARTLAAGGKLYAWIDAQPAQGTYSFDAPAPPGKRSAHRATLEVRFGRIAIKRPAFCSDKSAPEQIGLSVVEAKELPDSVVGDEAPIHWRLLTTHRVESIEDALRCVDWHRRRWRTAVQNPEEAGAGCRIQPGRNGGKV